MKRFLRVSDKSSWEKMRPWPVYMMATVVPVSLAATSVSKFLVFIFALVVLAAAVARERRLPQLSQLRTPAVVLLMLAALGLSLAYTTAPCPQALVDFGKYGKLLVIPLVLVLVRTRREAVIALLLYAGAQSFVVATSYLLSMGLVLPWVPKLQRLSIGTVYSSYIDQSIMTAGLAALCWHLRVQFPSRLARGLAVAVALVCAINVLFFLPGRSGQAALLAAIALGLYWHLPPRARPAAVFAPLALVAIAMAISPSFRDRLTAVKTESLAYVHGEQDLTSSGIRLNFWERAVEAIAEHPLAGTGVGSWNAEYRRLEGAELNAHSANVRNPHQEYLMWGVQLGIGGIVLLLAFLASMALDAARFSPEVRRATQSLIAMLAVVCLFNTTIFDALIGDYFCVLIGLLLVLGLQAASPGEAPA